MRRGENFSYGQPKGYPALKLRFLAPCIWANSEFSEAHINVEIKSYRPIPGSLPAMPRIILAMPPLLNIFIIFCICSNWLSS
jgi:hypothetical protein